MASTSKVITLKAYSRSWRLASALVSLSEAEGIDDYEIHVSLDYHPTLEEHIEVCKASSFWGTSNFNLYLPSQPLGCAGNTRKVLEIGFATGADHVIHMEDDMVLGRDCLQWLEWAFEEQDKNEDIFAVCTFNRASWKSQYTATESDKHSEISTNASESYLRAWFEMGGLWGTNRREWERIESKGGIFGALDSQLVAPGISGEGYRTLIRENDAGSWGWPFNLYFRSDRLCLFPNVSRSENTGDEPAPISTFNPGLEHHTAHISDPSYTGSDRWENTPFGELDRYIVDGYFFAEPVERV